MHFRNTPYYILGSLIPHIVGKTKVAVDDIVCEFTVSSRRDYISIKSLGGEQSIIKDAIHSIENQDIFYDIGGNKGVYSCFIGKKLDWGNVVIFEPSKDMYNDINSNLNMNGVAAHLHQVGLWDSNTRMQLGGDKNNSGQRVSGEGTKLQSEEEIELVKGDDYIPDERIPTPDVLKIDVEGAEVRVLRGMKGLLSNEVNLVYCEIHGWEDDEHLPSASDYGDDPKDVLRILQNTGFDIQELDPQKGKNNLVTRYGEKFIKAEK